MKFLIVLQAQGELTGLDEAPKGINAKIGILERGKVRAWSKLHCKEALSRKI
ncbi:hypothetical protein [Anaerotignum propionicum]|uniref:hypothetical protein n=1 Tax=Anaerotignum propionicum TaxID=28446 RepID=UPI00210ED639|nr:hypothetical protein [Anaerotignum propionicum]MCQ4936017.1 hypothetical protein [Anaerotignum propionicum]